MTIDETVFRMTITFSDGSDVDREKQLSRMSFCSGAGVMSPLRAISIAVCDHSRALEAA